MLAKRLLMLAVISFVAEQAVGNFEVQKCFNSPRHPDSGGYYLDACANHPSSPSGCESNPVATEFCKKEGFPDSVSRKVAAVGSLKPTMVLKTKHTCEKDWGNAPNCKGFSEICCGEKQNECVKPDESCMRQAQPPCQQKNSYFGKKNTTVSGKTCQMWNSQEFHSHTLGTEYGAVNFCRNPSESEGPWCYTTDKETRWEFCFEMCEPCIHEEKQCSFLNSLACQDPESYQGTKSTTVDGNPCLKWDSLSESNRQSATAHNYCRSAKVSGSWTVTQYAPVCYYNNTKGKEQRAFCFPPCTVDEYLKKVNIEPAAPLYEITEKCFNSPRHPDSGGYYLDACANHASIPSGCESKPVATEFCKKKGFPDSVSHNVAAVGSLKPTMVLQTKHTCEKDWGNAPNCKGFSEICCDLSVTQLGFIDSLPVKNNLNGDLKGMVQFAQSHTIFPTPESNWVQGDRFPLPQPVTHREALLIYIPADSTDASNFSVEAFLHGTLLEKVQLAPPSQFPRSDQQQYVNDSRPLLQYSLKAWSAVLPWNWMEDGLSLRITDSSSGKEGVLQNIEFESPAEVVLIMTRLGLLTPPVDKEMYMESSSEAAAKYFQTIPVARLTVGKYLPVHWKVVVKADGTIYNNTCSSDEGGGYSGDLRMEIGVGVISEGVQRANRGGSGVPKNPRFSIFLVPNTRGCYSNGIRTGCCTGSRYVPIISTTVGNEFCHELGHSMGFLPHLPEVGYHNQLSGWGYDAYRKEMIGNMKWTAYPDMFKYGSYRGAYSYGTDPMWGGHTDKYDYHPYTGFGARTMQETLSADLIADLHSPTGRYVWDKYAKKLVPYDNAEQLKPFAVGVPVITLLGYLDPQGELPSYIFPPLVGNYGHVYPLPKPDTTNDHCMLEVEYEDVSSTVSQPPFLSRSGSKVFQQIHLNNKLDKWYKPMNDVSVNLHWDSDFIPKKAALKCSVQGKETTLAERVFDNIPDHKSMSKPVIIGKKEGYSQVKPDEDKTIYKEF